VTVDLKLTTGKEIGLYTKGTIQNKVHSGNIKMGRRRAEYEYVAWTKLAQDSIWFFFTSIVNLPSSIKAGILLTN
jgi:hypothetical protein